MDEKDFHKGLHMFDHPYAKSSDEPPLVMQLSNLPIKDGLDIRHDGGGIETSPDNISSEPPSKKYKIELSSVAAVMNATSNNDYVSSKGTSVEKERNILSNIKICPNSVGSDMSELSELKSIRKSTELYMGKSLEDEMDQKNKLQIHSSSNIERNCGTSKSHEKNSSSNELTELAKSKLDYTNPKNQKENSLLSKEKCPYEMYDAIIKQSNILNSKLPYCDFNKSTETAGGNKPPLVMQSSNLPTEDGLDIRHDGGGLETSDDGSFFEPIMKDDSCNAIKDKIFSNSENSLENETFNSQNSKDKVDESAVLENDENSDGDLSDQTRVMEFDILDEFVCNDNDDRDSEDESDISLDELDALLEAGLENGKNCGSISNIEEFEHEEKQKVILKVRGKDHFDVLPEGWIEVTHNSGMPIYLHKVSRVCSVSKPYFLGPGSTRKHEIPISAIPCLHYLKELEKEKCQKIETAEITEDGETFPSAKIEVVKDTKELGSLDYLAIREYCQKRFEFQTITVKRFKTWSGRRKHQKQLKQKQRPSLPDSTKLITCPLPPSSDKATSNSGNTKREFIMNPSGKSPVCILHEYVQHTLRVQPRYIFKELENASTPYGAVVMINEMEYGSGYGSSKKQAKSEAAKAALDVLIPKMKMFAKDGRGSEEQQDVEFFDQVRVEDPRVCDLSVKAGQPYPYQILLECLKRNYGMGDTEIDFKMRNLKHQKNEFLMTVGKHSVSVVCKNKRDGKHRASQAILQLLHPHISSWGSLLRMYGKGSVKTLKEKKEAEQRITELQSQACANKPNLSILNKLKEEMLEYREKMKNKKPIGKLIPEQMNLSQSNSNLKNVEL